MASLFGFEIRRKKEEENVSFAPEVKDDGAVVVAEGGVYGTYVDLEGNAKTEAELVTKYREMAQHPEVDAAIDDIINEAVAYDSDENIIDLNLDDLEYSAGIKKKIKDEFDEILSLLDVQNQGYDVFRRWYVDGRLYYHAIIDEKDPSAGIKELRYIDPRKIRKVRTVKKEKANNANVTLARTGTEYYLYNEKGFLSSRTSTSGASGVGGIKIARDSILHCTSGLLDTKSSLVLSHLHKAIKPLNQLRTLEDASVIYRISRAPERRIFYIDVGNLPKMKAEQYLRDMMVKHKNRLVYDASSGEIRDDRKFMTMLEDFWLPRREGGRGTEITTLPGGTNLGEMEDVQYFQKNLYKSLNVPSSRLEADTGFSLGRSSEISRDEVKFSKFVDRLRTRFNHLFLKALEKQLVLKRIISIEEWSDIQSKLRFDYRTDSHFVELKEAELLSQRIQTARDMDEFVGKYFSQEYVRKQVLRQTDEDIEQMDDQIEIEKELESDELDLGPDDDGAEAPPEQDPAQQQYTLTPANGNGQG